MRKKAVTTRQDATPTERPERAVVPTPEGVELQVDELEERIAPKLAANHNESMLADR
jgi:hypothetical protein